MDYKQKYEEALKKARSFELPEYKNIMESVFPELKESEDEKIKKEITELVMQPTWKTEKDFRRRKELVDWLDKQCQESKKVSIWKHWKNGISGNGESKQIFLIKIGNVYSISSCLGCECDYIELAELDNLMLEKQGEQKEYTFKSLPRLLDMVEPTERAKAYCQKLIDSLLQEGYATDAKIVGDCIKQMNGEKVAMATMDEQKPTLRERYENISKSEWFKRTHEGMSVSDEQSKWSEEDEIVLRDIKAAVASYWYEDTENVILDWLKSLKQRMGG